MPGWAALRGRQTSSDTQRRPPSALGPPAAPPPPRAGVIPTAGSGRRSESRVLGVTAGSGHSAARVTPTALLPSVWCLSLWPPWHPESDETAHRPTSKPTTMREVSAKVPTRFLQRPAHSARDWRRRPASVSLLSVVSVLSFHNFCPSTAPPVTVPGSRGFSL